MGNDELNEIILSISKRGFFRKPKTKRLQSATATSSSSLNDLATNLEQLSLVVGAECPTEQDYLDSLYCNVSSGKVLDLRRQLADFLVSTNPAQSGWIEKTLGFSTKQLPRIKGRAFKLLIPHSHLKASSSTGQTLSCIGKTEKMKVSASMSAKLVASFKLVTQALNRLLILSYTSQTVLSSRQCRRLAAMVHSTHSRETTCDQRRFSKQVALSYASAVHGLEMAGALVVTGRHMLALEWVQITSLMPILLPFDYFSESESRCKGSKFGTLFVGNDVREIPVDLHLTSFIKRVQGRERASSVIMVSLTHRGGKKRLEYKKSGVKKKAPRAVLDVNVYEVDTA